MTEIEIRLPASFIVSHCDQVIETTAAQIGLSATLKGSLKQYPGSIHWHFKRGKERGVLEITLWPQEARAWISIHDNRQGAWVAEIIPILKTTIERSLHAH